MFEIEDKFRNRIVLLGIGGAGGNIVEKVYDSGKFDTVRMLSVDFPDYEFNSEYHRLTSDGALSATGTGGDVRLGAAAAQEQKAFFQQLVDDADLIILVAGLGGGMGSGALPEIARIARDQGVLTLCAVTVPFQFEGRKRIRLAEETLFHINDCADAYLCIRNQALLEKLPKHTTFISALDLVDQKLIAFLDGLLGIMTQSGLINLDFSDLRTSLQRSGALWYGEGEAGGGNRSCVAVAEAFDCMVQQKVDFSSPARAVVNISAGQNLSLGDFNEIGELVRQRLHPDTALILGSVIDPQLDDTVRVTLIISVSNHRVHLVGIDGGRRAHD